MREELAKGFADELMGAQSQIYSYIFSLLPDTHAALDVLQETNMFLWRKSDDFVGGNFFAWACSVARYRAMAYRRDKARDKRVFSDRLIGELADRFAARIPETSAMAEALNQCVEKLSLPARELLNARYSHGGSIAKIARQRQKSVNAISRACYRLRGMLLECVQRTVAREGAL